MSGIRGFGLPPPPWGPSPLDPLHPAAGGEDETSTVGSELQAPATANEIQSMFGDADAQLPFSSADRIRQMANHLMKLEQKLVLEQSENFRLREQVRQLERDNMQLTEELDMERMRRQHQQQQELFAAQELFSDHESREVKADLKHARKEIARLRAAARPLRIQPLSDSDTDTSESNEERTAVSSSDASSSSDHFWSEDDDDAMRRPRRGDLPYMRFSRTQQAPMRFSLPSLTNLYRELLMWRPSALGTTVAKRIQSRLKQVPPAFDDHHHYQRVMFPLLVEECRAGLKSQLDKLAILQVNPYSRSSDSNSRSLHATTVAAAITVNKTEAKGQITRITADVRLGAASSAAAAASSSAHAAGRSSRSSQSDSFGHDDLVFLWPRDHLIGADDDDALASCWINGFAIFGLLQSTDAKQGRGDRAGTGAMMDSSHAAAAKVNQPPFKLQLYFDSTDRNSSEALRNLRRVSHWFMCRVQNLRTLQREYSALASCGQIHLTPRILKPARRKATAAATAAAEASADPSDDMVLAGLPKPSTVDRLLPVLPSPIAARFNDAQRRSIATALANTRGFTLVQGRSGTGKTSTIVGIANLLYLQHQARQFLRGHPSSYRPDSTAINQTASKQASFRVPLFRLLICAPSDAAIDDLTDRLEDALVDQAGEKLALNIIRLESDGCKDTRSPATNGMSKAERMPFHARVSLEHLVDERIAEGKAANARTACGSISKATQTPAHHGVPSSSNSKPLTLRDHFKADLLTHAHIVCTTIDGAGSDFLRELGLRFPTVIIDDSTEVLEAQTLIALQHRATRCILVGDSKQFKTAPSSQSLFQRLHRSGLEAVRLRRQNRLHWEIMRWPSKTFYEDRLTTAPMTCVQFRAVLHRSDAESADSVQPSPDARLPYAIDAEKMRIHNDFYGDPSHAEVAVQLFAFLRRAWEASNRDVAARDPLAFVRSVGIISADPQQVSDLRRAFARHLTLDELPHLEIGSVDSFQGREKEFILFSVVRAGGDLALDRDWLSVALTQAVDVLTRTKTREQDDTWWHLLRDAQRQQRIVATTREGSIWRRTPRIVQRRRERSVAKIEVDSSTQVDAAQVAASSSVVVASPSNPVLDSASVGAESDRDSIDIVRQFGGLSLTQQEETFLQPNSASPVMVEHADAMPTDSEEKL